VFWIEFNLTEAPSLGHEAISPLALPMASLAEQVEKRTVLYVEDNPANLILIEQLIARRPDLSLICVTTGPLGLMFARSNQPSVILLDINLPGLNGIDVMKMLRADQSTAHIPVIAISANAMPRDISEAMKAGFFHYLTKPIKVNEFMHMLDAALKFLDTKAATKSAALKK
jgi:CheY-like chemotaxis protein